MHGLAFCSQSQTGWGLRAFLLLGLKKTLFERQIETATLFSDINIKSILLLMQDKN